MRAVLRVLSRRRFIAGLLASTACSLPVPSEPAAPAPPVVGATAGRAPIRIGLPVSLSGRFSREGQLQLAGYETWRQAANEQGGALVGTERLPVELTVADDQSEPLSAVRQVEQLVRQEGIRLFLGSVSSQIALAAATAAERLGALTLAPDASSPGVYGHGLQLLVSILPTEDHYFDGLAELAAGVAPRARPIGLLISDDPFYNTAAEGLRARAAALGIREVLVERFAAHETDLTPQVGRLAQARPRCLIVAGGADRIRGLLPTLRELEFSPPMRALVPIDPVGDGRLPPELDGALSVDWWSPELRSSGPVLGSAREFAARFRALHGYPPNSYTAAAAAAGLALQLGIERADSTDPRLVRASLGRLDVRTFWGRQAWDADGRARGEVPVLQVQ
ncbi:MAG: ABC transporter substrate-binding protein, partial [Chloroflexota bacterium]|nr:ABC transporter substrate-binding protein [Chloroflexota bacterium]